ncbi:hypothetical protein ACHAXS_009457 [Conticribra weissflogii]
MPIDEFGREVPASTSAYPLHHRARSRSRSRSRSLDRDRDREPSGRPRSPPRDDPHRERGGRSRANSRGISPSPDGEPRRHRGRSRGDSEYDYDDRHGDSRRRGRSHSGDYRRHGSSGGRRGRGGSYDEGGEEYHGGGDRHHPHHHHHPPHGSRHGSHHGRGKSSKPHPSEKYAEEPMLCQFLWKKELEKDAKIARGEGAMGKHDAAMSSEEVDGDSKENYGSSADIREEGEPSTEQPPPTEEPDPLFESPEAEAEAYADYNMKYCLNYVRTFFNHHLDDPWFRQRLSPLEAVRKARRERVRANAEAAEFRKEILNSLEEQQSGVIPKKDPDCPDYLGPPKCNFVSGCRLGVGTKPTASLITAPFYRRRNNSHYDDDYPHEEESHHIVLQGEDRNRIERHAKSHLHSFIKSDTCIKIEDVPPHATDEQISASLAEHCTVKPPTSVWSSAVFVPSGGASGSTDPYHRTVYAVFPSRDAKDNLIENLHRANEDASRGHRRDREDRHPRTRDGRDGIPGVLHLDVDCTDVYGRRQVDADGKGGAPPLTDEQKASKKQPDLSLPTRRCTVFVSTASLAPSQPVSVLSAAVSSRARIARDRDSVSTIALTLDEVRGIKAGNRLDDLLRLLYPGKELENVDDEDILDVSIAYLRRVHLFSFYNGCTAASDVGNVLSGQHPAGTIHLRLRDADEILRKAAEEKGNVPLTEGGDEDRNNDKENRDGEDDEDSSKKEGNAVVTDMLVMRLNNSISKALDHVKMLAYRGSSCLVDEATDAAARAIELQEQQTKNEWIENHGLIDGDDRARCSFHFCHKLFKDRAFLQKHLIKKHSDQLRAECGKCHDEAMMSAWDNDENRPVPGVLIDCGSKFGLVTCAVKGSDKPMAVDPEPELWREEEERMAEEERKYRERQAAAEAAARAEEMEQKRRQEEMAAIAAEKRKGNFVDVDDMPEEKVELSFEDVVVAPPPKKKKKKKKLL